MSAPSPAYRHSKGAGEAAPAAAARFTAQGRGRIEHFLADDAARHLRDALVASDAWREVLNAGAKVFELDRAARATFPPGQREALDEAVRAQATTGFQFRYETIRVREDGAPGPVPALDAFAGCMNAPATLDWLRTVTGLRAIDVVDAQATAYRPGDFLTGHDDDVAGKHRLAAYVVSLTPHWRPEFGGMLCFPDSSGGIEGYVPAFNALTLFRVPQPHFVSEVASYAPGPRLSVTGWLRSRG